MQGALGCHNRRWWWAGLLIMAFVMTTVQASDEDYLDYFSETVHPLDSPEPLEPLYEAIGDRRFVLLGESSHGTHEYYHWRAEISRHLIEHHGKQFVAIEGDWQAVNQLNDFVKLDQADTEDARTFLRNAEMRWPRWMWVNEEFADLLDWLRNYNQQLPADERIGVYGLDMQDAEGSARQVIAWFAEHAPEHQAEVEGVYQHLFNFPEGMRGYAQQLAQGGERVNVPVAQIADYLNEQMARTGDEAPRHLWIAYENARVVQRAEKQFHAATQQGPDSWNTRASFMHEALLRLAERHGRQSRGIVWAHNTHVGDASATAMANSGQVNIGQLLRESEGHQNVFILGFGTHAGKVYASDRWGGQPQLMEVIPAEPDSVEGLLYRSGIQEGLLIFDDAARASEALGPRNQRAIGVIYQPPNEAYVPTLLTRRYDGLLYFDTTEAVSPLENGQE